MANSRRTRTQSINTSVEVNCPRCHRWIHLDAKGRYKSHNDPLYNPCPKGGKPFRRVLSTGEKCPVCSETNYSPRDKTCCL